MGWLFAICGAASPCLDDEPSDTRGADGAAQRQQRQTPQTTANTSQSERKEQDSPVYNQELEVRAFSKIMKARQRAMASTSPNGNYAALHDPTRPPLSPQSSSAQSPLDAYRAFEKYSEVAAEVSKFVMGRLAGLYGVEHEEFTRTSQLVGLRHTGMPMDPESGALEDFDRVQTWVSALATYSAFCETLGQKYAQRLHAMPPAVAGPMSSYLSTINRHGNLAQALREALLAHQNGAPVG